MTAPDWAVEAWDAMWEAHAEAHFSVTQGSDDIALWSPAEEAATQAAALELSRRCVPVEEYQRVVELANKLDGYTLHKTQCALYQSSYAMNFPECSCGLTDAREDLLTRAALKETGNAE